jgi:hypothetical protein
MYITHSTHIMGCEIIMLHVKFDVFVLNGSLYLRLSEDGDLLLKHVREFVFMDNLQFYKTYVRMLVYITDYKRNTRNG